jgi:hypothetical protein
VDHALGTLLIAGAVAAASEYVDSALGMGYGTTLAPILLLVGFNPLDLVPVVLGSEFVTGLLASGGSPFDPLDQPARAGRFHAHRLETESDSGRLTQRSHPDAGSAVFDAPGSSIQRPPFFW